jgi:hypothetical protein
MAEPTPSETELLIELKKEVNSLLARLGEPERYRIVP